MASMPEYVSRKLAHRNRPAHSHASCSISGERVEPTPRVELGTSFLPRMRSATELCGHQGASRNPGTIAHHATRPAYSLRCYPLVQGGGFEPPKHKAAGLQPAGFDRSPIPAQTFILSHQQRTSQQHYENRNALINKKNRESRNSRNSDQARKRKRMPTQHSAP